MRTAILLLLFVSVGCSQIINPKTDLKSYDFMFSQTTAAAFDMLKPDTLWLSGDNVMHFSWLAPTTCVKLEEQPDPHEFPKLGNMIVITVPNDSVNYSGTANAAKKIRITGFLMHGNWQVQLRATMELSSKYSDAVPFVVRQAVYPPMVPASLNVRF